MTSTNPDSKITPEAVEKVQAEVQNVIDSLAKQLPPESGSRMKDVMAFRMSITAETDRGAALMSAAYLDDKLKELIEKRLVQNNLADFSTPLFLIVWRAD